MNEYEEMLLLNGVRDFVEADLFWLWVLLGTLLVVAGWEFATREHETKEKP